MQWVQECSLWLSLLLSGSSAVGCSLPVSTKSWESRGGSSHFKTVLHLCLAISLVRGTNYVSIMGEEDFLVPWGKPGPHCFVQGLSSSPENRLVGSGMGVRWLLFFFCSMRVSDQLACGSNHSCLLCDSRCCLRCRKTAGKWKKEAHPSDTEAQGLLALGTEAELHMAPVCFQTETYEEQGLFPCWISHAGVGLKTKQLLKNYIQT